MVELGLGEGFCLGEGLSLPWAGRVFSLQERDTEAGIEIGGCQSHLS